jgi:hypothetical protein
MTSEDALRTCQALLIQRPSRDYFATSGWELLAEETLRQVFEALGDHQAAGMIAQNQRIAIEEHYRQKKANAEEVYRRFLSTGVAP